MTIGACSQTGSLCAMLYKYVRVTAANPDLVLTLRVMLICRAPGNVVDYMYAKAGIKYAYAVHLRDTGTVRSVSSPRLRLVMLIVP